MRLIFEYDDRTEVTAKCRYLGEDVKFRGAHAVANRPDKRSCQQLLDTLIMFDVVKPTKHNYWIE